MPPRQRQQTNFETLLLILGANQQNRNLDNYDFLPVIDIDEQVYDNLLNDITQKAVRTPNNTISKTYFLEDGIEPVEDILKNMPVNLYERNDHQLQRQISVFTNNGVVDEIKLNVNATASLNNELDSIRNDSTAKYIIYSNSFSRPHYGKKNYATHLSALIILNGKVYSVGLGPENTPEGLNHFYDVTSFLNTPEETNLRRANDNENLISVFDIGYFTIDMKDRLRQVVNNIEQLKTVARIYRKQGRFELSFSGFRGKLRDVKYYYLSSRSSGNNLPVRVNCTSFIEFIFSKKISCGYPICGKNMSFLTSDPSQCKRLTGSQDQFLNNDSSTNYNALFRAVHTNLLNNNLDQLGGNMARKKKTIKYRKRKNRNKNRNRSLKNK